MIKSLYAKFAIILIIVFSITGICFSVLTIYISKNYLQEINHQAHRNLAKNILRQRKLIIDNKVNHQALKETFHHYMTVNPSLEFYLLDKQGNIVIFSADPAKVKRNRVNLDSFAKQLKVNSPIIKGDDPRSIQGSKYFSVAPIPNINNPQGYLYIILQSQAIEQIYQEMADINLFKFLLYSLLVSLFIGLLIGLGLFYYPALRLKKLSQSMLSFKETGFTKQLTRDNYKNLQNSDEIMLLEQSFNEMAHHITQQMLQLKKQDKLRRSMIANISHDLRTPLASIFGYLEVLHLKDNSLTKEQRQQYLKTALNSSHQLGRLIDDLFELAKLEASETPPHIESFSLIELILDVVNKFAIIAKRKNIQLSINCDKDTPFVYADISLIERALNNLIGNAIKHNESGTKIDVLVMKKEGLLEIIVEDNGKGISLDHQQHIFEQFYQVGNNHRQGNNSGLGLAITKRIVELHGQVIRLKSELRKGACFSFSLPTSNIF